MKYAFFIFNNYWTLTNTHCKATAKTLTQFI